MRRLSLSILMVGAFAAAGCGGGGGLDVGKAERTIADEVEKQTATQEVKIDCPDDVDQKKGDVFECDLSARGGVKATVKVTQVDDDGNVRWEVNP